MSGDLVPVALLDALATRARASAERPVVLVDGGSGAGKTTLATLLLPRLATSAGPAQLVSLDDIYPGWDGLAAGAAAVPRDILRAEEPGWRRWDWRLEREAEWHPLDARRPLVVEGCGALGRAARARASLGVWVELDAVARRRRALGRDGDLYAPHWERWAAQEAAFRSLEPPDSLADVVVDVLASVLRGS